MQRDPELCSPAQFSTFFCCGCRHRDAEFWEGRLIESPAIKWCCLPQDTSPSKVGGREEVADAVTFGDRIEVIDLEGWLLENRIKSARLMIATSRRYLLRWQMVSRY